MGEYQYYEFRTIDRALSDKEMKEMRAVSTRAEITRTSFVNEYMYGDFKGDEDEWMGKYFDAFIYYANWGTHIFKLSFPVEMLDSKAIQAYSTDDSLEIIKKNNKIILSFISRDEDGGEWVDAGDWPISSLLPIRNDLMRGDFRALYIGWLRQVQDMVDDEEYEDEYDKEEIEPPVPPGLAELNESLTSLVEFLDIDLDLLNAAATRSSPLKDAIPGQDVIHQWLANLNSTEKDKWLTHILINSMEDNQESVNQLLHSFLKDQKKIDNHSEQKRRTIGELKAEAKHIAEKRKQRQAEEKAKEKERKEEQRQLEREKYLNELAGRESMVWKQVEELINKGQAASYQKARDLLKDLRDLAERTNKHDKFHTRLTDLRAKNERRRSFIQMLNGADLT